MPTSRPRPGQPGIHPTIDEIAVQREQDKRVLDLALSGLNGAQIAAELQVDRSTITRTLQRVWNRNESPRATELRQLWDLRIEAALNAIWPKLLNGDVAAIHAFCRLEERAAKLHGLDQQTVKDAGALADALLGDPDARRERAAHLRDELKEARERHAAEAASG